MKAGFERVTLRNGHRAIRDLVSGEVMHPSVGPWAEANLLYVEQSRLMERLAGSPSEAPLVLFDVGLGAAANAAAAIICARRLGARRRPLVLVSFERALEPLQLALDDPEGFPFLPPIRPLSEVLLAHNAAEEPGLRWELHRGELEETLPRQSWRADVVFHDPFSPDSNPTLWTPAFFSLLRTHCAPTGATVFTYSAATPTRVSLLLAGFFVGYGVAVGTKKETTVAATNQADLARPLGAEWLARWRRSDAASPHGPLSPPDWRAQIEHHPQF